MLNKKMASLVQISKDSRSPLHHEDLVDMIQKGEKALRQRNKEKKKKTWLLIRN